jgi:hypothetical protein
MSNARVHYKMAIRRRAAPTGRRGGVEAPSVHLNGKGGSLRQVLEPDRTPCTLVLVLHKEAMNQHPGMAYFGGIFGDGEVSIRALDYDSRGLISGAGYFRFGWILEDEGIFTVLESSFGIVLYQVVFRASVMGLGAYDRSTWGSVVTWSDSGW